LKGYWQLYQKQGAQLLEERGSLVTDHPDPVATTWSLSFAQVEKRSAAAADLLRVCAFLHPDTIPEEIIAEGAAALGPNVQAVAENPLAFNQAIGVLLSYSLLKRQPEEGFLSMHRLVQAVILDELDEETTQQATILTRLVTVLTKHFPEVDHPNWEACERLVPHIQAVAAQLEQHSTAQVAAAALFGQAGQYLQERGRYEQAAPTTLRVSTLHRASTQRQSRSTSAPCASGNRR
jgi:hypothetical protein